MRNAAAAYLTRKSENFASAARAGPMKEQKGNAGFYRAQWLEGPGPRVPALRRQANSVSSSTKKHRGGKTATNTRGGKPTSSGRKAAVFISLVAVLTLTSGLLLALAPAPLTPGAAHSLFAVEAPASLDVIFDAQTPVNTDRWQYIYVHHTKTPSGSAASLATSPAGLADHFLIGNGDGCADGELQLSQRWSHQQSAGRIAGLDSIDPACISITLVGDFDQARPTPTQMRRLTQLVTALQNRLHIPAERVWLVQSPQGAAGVGKYFEIPQLREQLLP